jgi:hypothetical protein
MNVTFQLYISHVNNLDHKFFIFMLISSNWNSQLIFSRKLKLWIFVEEHGPEEKNLKNEKGLKDIIFGEK